MLKNVALFFISLFFLMTAIVWNSHVQHRFSASSLHRQVAFLLNQETKKLKQEADRIKHDSAFLWSSLKYPFFLIENDSIKKWSQTNVVIQTADMREPFEWKFRHTPTSDFILYKKEWKPNIFLVGVLILKKGYALENRYLTAEWNTDIFPSGTAEILPIPDHNFLPIQVEGVQFGLRITNDLYPENDVSIGLAAGSIFFFLLLIYRISRQLHYRKKYLLNFLFISEALVLLRISMVSFSYPARWIKSDFFNPRYFASSSFNASAGDFLLNALIVTIACGYLFFNIHPIIFLATQRLEPIKRNIAFTGLMAASYFAFLFPNLFVEAIFHDSALSFDITSAAPFGILRVLVMLAFLLGCLSSFFVVVTFLRLIKSGADSVQFLMVLFLGALLFLVYFIFSELHYWPTFWVGTILFLFLFFSPTIDLLYKIEYKTLFPVLIIISCYAAQSAWATHQFAEEKKCKSMFRAANELIANDILAEYLIAQSIPRIANTSTVIFQKNNSSLVNQEKQRINSILSNEYLDRYKVAIYLFYADGLPVESNQPDDFSTAIKRIERQSVKTNYEGVYLLQRRNAADVRHYVAAIPIKRKEKSQGFVLIHLSLVRVFSDRVYPELTLDNRLVRSIRNNDFSYAFYNQSSLLDQFGEMNFKHEVDQNLLLDKDLYNKGKIVNNFWLVAAEDETGRRVVVAARQATIFSIAANFSFIFVMGIALSFLFFLASLLRAGFRQRSMDYSTRIQFLAYLFFILPLLAVSAISLRMLTQSNEAEQEKEMSNKGIHLTERLSSFLDTDSLKQMNGTERKLKLIISSAEMDINFYDASGHLLGTNQPSIFENQLVMPLLNRKAWEDMVAQQHNSLVLKNNIGALEYNSRYFAIYNTQHVLSGVLELPFFESSTDALKVNLITNILVTFAVVFILFSFVAESAIKKITSPLRLIANRLNETKLTENKPIEWKNNDEIGMLVTEYNKMINNLTISRNELARTQKENAWREIAQQVAHEIKNPLTPMKLTLQHLEQLMKQNSFDKARVEKSLQTLLEQLQILNDIAGSFSSFASLPKPVISTVNLTDLLHRTVLFFQNHTLGKVFFRSPTQSLLVQADELLLSRIFSNIILNALQSGLENRPVDVEIETTIEDKFVVVSIKDNGTGIDRALIDRIFLPHFTTKKSGSGLGLAIAKRSLEQMGGEIGFDTSPGGTTFFVRIAV